MSRGKQYTNGNVDKIMAALVKRFPQHRDAALRLARLADETLPTVVVLGHYNHGKSSLLNALIGEDCFAVSNKRETVNVKAHDHAGIRWVDTPGLDADISGEDDRKALDAASQEADLRVLVHAADLGELDRNEAAMAANLIEEQQASGRAFLLALTRVDKVSADDRAAIMAAIQAQAPGASILAVSSHLGVRGRKENKPRLAALGNLDALQAEISQAVKATDAKREAERSRLLADMRDSIAEEKKKLLNERQWLRDSREVKLAVLAPDLTLSMTTFNNEVLMG